MFLEKIKYIDFSSKNILLAVMTIIAMFGMYGWLIKPHTQYIKAAENYEDAINTLEEKRLVYGGELKRDQKKLIALTDRLNQSKSDYFDVADARVFLESTQSKIQNFGCLVDTLKFLPARQLVEQQKNSRIDMLEYKVEISILGQYPNIVNFIAELQNQNKKVWIEEINLHATGRNNGALMCDLAVTIYTMKVKERTDNVEN